jgi:hypothetical protein
MSTSVSYVQDSRDDARHSPRAESPDGGRARRTINRFVRWSPLQPLDSRIQLGSLHHRTTSENVITGRERRGYLSEAISLCRKLKRQLAHFKNEVREVICETPHYAGTGSIGEIVPP